MWKLIKRCFGLYFKPSTGFDLWVRWILITVSNSDILQFTIASNSEILQFTIASKSEILLFTIASKREILLFSIANKSEILLFSIANKSDCAHHSNITTVAYMTTYTICDFNQFYELRNEF